jgi:hypothetical protein
MKKKQSVLQKLYGIAFILFPFSLLQATERNQNTLFEDSLCDYSWNRDINGCTNVLECIYTCSWQDTVIEVPANVTRISKDSFKLCLDDIAHKKLADIIYIMDMSYSMSQNCIPEINCPNNPYSGDPHMKRDDAFQAGLNYQITASPQSKAGYIGFAGDVLSDYVLSPVTVGTGQDQLNDMVINLREFMENDIMVGGTNYRAPLDKALLWLQDPLICPQDTKAIIFISDGRPISGPPSAEQVSYLKNNNIPVYGVLLGQEMINDLLDLAVETNGTAFLVPPSSSDTLETVVSNIVKSLIKDYQQETLQIVNTTTNVTATGVSFGKLGDISWTANLDRFIPLSENLNEIQVTSKFGVQDGTGDTSIAFSFHVNVNGLYRSECYSCRSKTTLEVLVDNSPIDTLSCQHSQYTNRLKIVN